MFFLHILILYHLLEEVIFTLYYLYTTTIAEFSKEGCLIPILFVWEDGRKYKIDKILKIERCASRKAGGVGTMYTCMVQGKESHLFFEVDKWFMERKIS